MQLYLGNCLYGLPFKQYNERVLWGKTLARVVKRLDFKLNVQTNMFNHTKPERYAANATCRFFTCFRNNIF